MSRLLRTLIVVFTNTLAIATLAAYVVGQYRIVQLNARTPMAAVLVGLDSTGVTATQLRPGWSLSIVTSPHSGEHRRWERLFKSPDSWRKFGFAYHSARANEQPGGFGMLDVVTSPDFGVTHRLLITLAALLCVLVYRRSCKNVRAWIRTRRSDV